MAQKRNHRYSTCNFHTRSSARCMCHLKRQQSGLKAVIFIFRSDLAVLERYSNISRHAHPEELTNNFSQDNTSPDQPSFGVLKGSCGYGLLMRNEWPYWQAAAIAPGNPLYSSGNPKGCGSCIQATCTSVSCFPLLSDLQAACIRRNTSSMYQLIMYAA